jgi:hypothetical protein
LPAGSPAPALGVGACRHRGDCRQAGRAGVAVSKADLG